MNDDVLSDILNRETELKAEIKQQLEKEITCKKFVSQQERHAFYDEWVNPILRKISSFHSEMYNEINRQTPVMFDLIRVKDLQVSLVPDYVQIITELHTIYADTDDREKAMEMATKIKGDIEQFDAFLRERNPRLRAIGAECSDYNFLSVYGYDVHVEAKNIDRI